MNEILFKIKENNATADYAEFVIEPLESGYGHTLASALRRVLLTSLPGVAITSVKIDGVKHKFSELTGLKENIVDLLLNLKGLYVQIPESQTTATLKISVKGVKEITGADVTSPDGAEIVNKDHYIASVSGEKAKLEMELTVDRGFGYSLSEERPADAVGVIVADAVFSPVKRVNYTVESTRVGQRTNLDKLVMHIWTNGSVSPREALDQSAELLAKYFTQIFQPTVEVEVEKDHATMPAISDEVLKLTVDELDLPTRIYNSLRNGGIETISQLLGTPRKDLINMRNMGVKSITIIEDKLKDKGVSLVI